MKEVKTDIIIDTCLNLLARREKDGMAVEFTASEIFSKLRQAGHHPSLVHLREVLKTNFAHGFVPSAAGYIAGHNVYTLPTQENAK